MRTADGIIKHLLLNIRLATVAEHKLTEDDIRDLMSDFRNHVLEEAAQVAFESCEGIQSKRICVCAKKIRALKK